MLEIGSVIDKKYKILNKIGQGGMSVVYLAMNEKANKQWAIKEVRKDGVQDFEVIKQCLVAEIDMLKRLDHTNLPSIIDVIDGDGSFLIVMDYVEGKSLYDALKDYGAQPQENVIEWAKQLCDVLGYLHSRQPSIIYRDMKPANVMLKPDGNVTLIDFGTAREFKATSVEDTKCLGTQGYAAPEQYGGHGQTDARTDIYCLGTTLYHLVTGHNPCKPPYEMYPIRQWDPNLSSGLEQIIIKCTQRNPNDRYQSCAELLYALEHYNELDEGFKKIQNRKYTAFITSALLTVVCLVGATGFKYLEGKTTKDNYGRYVKEAASSIDKNEMIDLYKTAIELDPSKSDAYIGLLENGYLDDSDFADDEQLQIRQFMQETGDDSKQNIQYLETDEVGYSEFAYDLGLAYFFNCKSGNKGTAAPWFDDVKNMDVLGKEQMSLAERLGRMANYYNDLNKINDSGESKTSYSDYWIDLNSLTEGNLVEDTNTITALRMYRELVNQIATNCKKFKEAGVTRLNIDKKLTSIEQHIKDEVLNSSQASSEKAKELLADIETGIEIARREMATTYENRLPEETEGKANE
ncbi:MAG: serine/threonine-protein kinase [Lachnospiraceae bacterium]